MKVRRPLLGTRSHGIFLRQMLLHIWASMQLPFGLEELVHMKQPRHALTEGEGLLITACVFNHLCCLFSFYPEPPSLAVYPSPLPLIVPGQSLTVHCEASGFAPLPLELSWEFKGADGKTRSLGSGSLTGHRQAWDGTYGQNTRLELDTAKMDLGRGGELICVAAHLGGTRRASSTLNIIGMWKNLDT